MYGILGIFAAAPSIHLLLAEKFYSDNSGFSSSTTVTYYAIMGAIYLSGLAILTFRVPERWVPHTFDIIGSSH